jgi:membrane protease YdiL (CAAX protease family)
MNELFCKKFFRQWRIYILMLLAITLFWAASVRQGRPKPLAAPGAWQEQDLEKVLKYKLALRKEGKLDEKSSFRLYLLGAAGAAGLIAIVLGIVLNAKVMLLKLRGRPLVFKRTRDIGDSRWGISDVIKVAIIFVFSAGVLSLAQVLGASLGLPRLDFNLRLIVNTALMDLFCLAAIVYFVVVKHKADLKSLGISIKSFFANVLVGISGYIFILPILFAALTIVIKIADLFNFQPPPEPIFSLFFKEERTVVLLFSGALAVFLAPLIEEVFFRGFMYSAIRKNLGPGLAMVISAGLFSLLHTNVIGFFPIALLGILLAYLYEKTGSLVAPITVHILHNGAILTFLFLAKGLLK